MNLNQLDRSQHIYISPNFDEIIQDTIRFFNGTPVHPMPIPDRFHGTGIYAIYCIAKTGMYARFNIMNKTSLQIPIYIGKAVPKGWRQARKPQSLDTKSYELHHRIQEHSRSIHSGSGLTISDFFCRFIILEGKESDLISTVEAALSRQYQPIWNTLIDGFGNHDPGKGRYKQARSDWDVCHPGQSWAEKCQGVANDQEALFKKIEAYMTHLSNGNI